MRFFDTLEWILGSIGAYKGRSFLTGLGITIGIATVVLLTSMGGGVHRFIVQQFTQFGTHLIAITPGKTQTFGLSGALISTVRPLTTEDARALRHLPQLEGIVPMVMGNVEIKGGGHTRRTTLFGVGPDLPRVWKIPIASGRFLPPGNRPLVALGATVRKELFGNQSVLGKRLRIAGEGYRIVGVLSHKGKMLGFDMDDAVYVPVARALDLFDREGVMEIDILYSSAADSGRLADRIRKLLRLRHGREDFTLITQDQMLETLGSVLDVLTLAVAALGAISLVVGGIGILTIQTVAISERRSEIGLLRALGASRRQIITLFLGEAILLASLGGLGGLVLGSAGTWLIAYLFPELPAHLQWNYVMAAIGVAVVIGLSAGAVPAWRAAKMDPIIALRRE